SDGTMKVWDIGAGEEYRLGLASLSSLPSAHTLANVAVAVAGKQPLTIRGHQGRVLRVAFAPTDKRIASARAAGVVRPWDATSRGELRRLPGHAVVVTALAFSPDGRRLASAVWDRTVRVWDAETGEPAFIWSGHTQHLADVCFNSSGGIVGSAGDDQ